MIHGMSTYTSKAALHVNIIGTTLRTTQNNPGHHRRQRLQPLLLPPRTPFSQNTEPTAIVGNPSRGGPTSAHDSMTRRTQRTRHTPPPCTPQKEPHLVENLPEGATRTFAAAALSWSTPDLLCRPRTPLSGLPIRTPIATHPYRSSV